jgi:DNA invertase Pin-like site-specific DNA recombinase
VFKKPHSKTPPNLPNFKVGYARVSTDEQCLDLQLDALKAAGCHQIYQEKASGKNTDRPELSNCLKALRPGDTLVVWKLDRLGRSLIDLVNIINILPERGVNFESLTEKLDTSSSTGQLIFHVFAAMADFERSVIKERTIAGLAAAKKKGRIGGRPRKLSPEKLNDARKMIESGMTFKTVAELFEVSKTTLWSRLRG